MQKRPHISFNAVRTFTEVAKICSISRAALTLNVTPSAVSHQIKNLEQDLGISLFLRTNNAIELTERGKRLYEEVVVGIQIIEKSIETLQQDENEITLRVVLDFAMRWLIPALEDFKQQNPQAKIRVETFNDANHNKENNANDDADLTITYKRVLSKQKHYTPILKDFSRPIIAPTLLSKVDYKQKTDITKLPALVCTADNWDWRYWTQQMNINFEEMQFTHHFDLDDTSIRAAVAGLGTVLATPIAIQNELTAGSLVELPYIEPLLTGTYYLIEGKRKTRLIEAFKNWLIISLHGLEK